MKSVTSICYTIDSTVELSMKKLFLTTITQPPEVIVNKFFVSVSFFFFPFSKGQVVRAYQDTILIIDWLYEWMNIWMDEVLKWISECISASVLSKYMSPAHWVQGYWSIHEALMEYIYFSHQTATTKSRESRSTLGSYTSNQSAPWYLNYQGDMILF